MSLFDASAIMDLAVERGSKAIDAVAGGSALTLTYYEIGNSIWKLHNLQRKLSNEGALALLGVSLRLYERLDILNLDASDATPIEKLASLHGITFYDSAYLYCAKRNKLILVTDDKRLGKVAIKEEVKTASSEQISPISRN